MKVLLLSDTHGRMNKILSILARHQDIEFTIHLGDYGTDIDILNDTYPKLLTEAVQGNNDKSTAYPLEKVLQLAGKKILITHGHLYHVGRGLKPIIEKALQEKADVVAFGHTHVPFIEQRDGLLLINPGSLFRPKRQYGPTYAILDLTCVTIHANIFSVQALKGAFPKI